MHTSVLVTGGSGLLGLNWAVTMRNRVAVTLGMHGRMVALSGTRSVMLKLEDEASVLRAIESSAATLVVHAAGLTNVEACEADPVRAAHVNVTLAEQVARACVKAGVDLVQISTDHLFNGDRSMLTESDPVAPQNVYARTKAEAEERVLDVKPDTLVVRTNFYGWGPSYRRSFSDFIVDSVRAGQPVTLFRDVTYCPILAQPLVEAIHELAWLRASGIFHVVADGELTKYEFGRRLVRRFGLSEELLVSCSIQDKLGLVQRPHRMSLSNAKATAALGRAIGGASEQIELLKSQEYNPSTAEIRRL